MTGKCLGFLDEMLDTAGDSIDIVYMADDYCSQLGPLFSPELSQEFVVPYLTRFVDRVHRAGRKFLPHVCGVGALREEPVLSARSGGARR